MSEVVDAYAHVGLPRFQTFEDYWGRARGAGIGKAVLSAFDASPDLQYLAGIARAEPDRIRVLGVPVGEGAQRPASVRVQLAAGFIGVRIADRDLSGADDVLDDIAAGGGIAVVCGTAVSQPAGARRLLDHLERHPGAIVVGGHFAAPGASEVLADGAVGELFGHPRFHVVFSRHGAFDARLLEAWASAVLERTGWERVLWGSESPVLHWRNETLESAVAWVDRLAPTPAQRDGFFGGNARRVFFEASPRVVPLRLDSDPWRSAPRMAAVLWANGLPVRQELAGRLLHSWNLSPHRESTLGEHLERLLDGVLPSLPQNVAESANDR